MSLLKVVFPNFYLWDGTFCDSLGKFSESKEICILQFYNSTSFKINVNESQYLYFIYYIYIPARLWFCLCYSYKEIYLINLANNALK